MKAPTIDDDELQDGMDDAADDLSSDIQDSAQNLKNRKNKKKNKNSKSSNKTDTPGKPRQSLQDRLDSFADKTNKTANDISKIDPKKPDVNFSEAAKKGREQGKKAAENVKNAPENIKKGAENLGDSIAEKTHDLPRKAREGASKAFKKAKEGLGKLKEAPGKIVNAAKNGLNGLKESVKTALNPKRLLEKLDPRRLLDKLNPINAIKRRFDKVRKTINNIRNLPKNIKKAGQKIKNTAKNTAKAIKNLPKTIKNTVQAAIKAAKAIAKLIVEMVKLAIKLTKAAIQLAAKLIELAIQLINALIQFIVAFWWLILIVLAVILLIWLIYIIITEISSTTNEKTMTGEHERNTGEVSEDGKVQVTTISSTNKVIEAFYQYFAEKSIWVVYEGTVYDDEQIKEDTTYGGVYEPMQVNSAEYNSHFISNETGETILKDYYNRESMFYVNPNTLFLFDKYLNKELFRFPEQLVQHVAYDGTQATIEAGGRYTLRQLMNDEGNLNVTSTSYSTVPFTNASTEFQAEYVNQGIDKVYVANGQQIDGIWDYGLGSILHYVKYIIKHEERGSYDEFDVWDTTIESDERGLQSSGEVLTLNYQLYENATNKDNFEVTDIAELTGDDRLVTYTADDFPDRADLQDEDSYFIDWVVTPAGDVTNYVVYEWADSGIPFQYNEPCTETVTHTWETIETKTMTDQTITRAQQSSNSSSASCESTSYYYTKKELPTSVRDASGNLVAATWVEDSKQTYTWECTGVKVYDCGDLPLNVNNDTSNDDDTHEHTASCDTHCNHLCILHPIACFSSCSHNVHNDDCTVYDCGDLPLNVNSDTSNDNDGHNHTDSCPYHYDHSGCEYGTVTQNYTEEYVEYHEEDIAVTFNNWIRGTKWNRAPYYDGEPNMDNLSGAKYYEDYIKEYEVYAPFSVSGLFDVEEMLKRMQIEAGSEDEVEQLEAILARQDVTNLGSSVEGSGYSLGEGLTRFEQLYNGSAKEVINQIWDGLIGWGYSPEQAAAVMGNIYNESTFRLDASNGTHFGLCQWGGGRYTALQNFASTVNGTTWTDLNSQIQFLCMELDATNDYAYTDVQWSTGGDTWTTSMDVSELTKAMALRWERFATVDAYNSGNSDVVNEVSERQQDAMSAYTLLYNRVPTYSITTITPDTTDLNPSSSNTLGTVLNSIWSWISTTVTENWQSLTNLFGKDEEYSILDEAERTYWRGGPITEDKKKLIMASIFAYTESESVNEYYGQIDVDFFREHFTTLFSNPIGTSWSAASNQSSIVSFNASVRQQYYPNGFAKPFETCKLSSTTSSYGIYLQATNRQNVYSSVNGTVYDIGEDDRYGGSYIILDNGYSRTIYGCVTNVQVAEGDTVTTGQVIAEVNGSELFFGITNLNNVYVNPSFVLAGFGDVNSTYPTSGPCTTMPIIKQKDAALKEYPYGSSTIGRSGCGVCSFSMILSQINGGVYSPSDVTESLNLIAANNNQNYTFYYIPGKGSTWSCWQPLAEYYGLSYVDTDNKSASSIKSLLDQGYYVMISISGTSSSPYKGSGHFIVIRGYDDAGFYINDSNSGSGAYNENIPYTYNQLGKVKSVRAIGP